MPTTATPRQVALDYLQQAISSRRWPAGTVLPPERDLAAACGVSRTALRWALDRLLQTEVLERISPRTLQVRRGERASWEALASGTIVLLTAQPVPRESHRMPGWTEHIDAAAYRALAGSGRTVLTLNPSTCVDGWPDILRAVPPAAVVVPDLDAVGYTRDELAAAWRVLHDLAVAGIPIVTYGEALPDSPVDRVVSDHEEGGRLLAANLLERGHRRLMPVFPRSVIGLPWAQARLRGIANACRQVGVEAIPPRWIDLPRGTATPEAFARQVETLSGVLVAELLAADPPDALLAVSDGFVPGLAAAARRCGREPGTGLAIAGYDHYWPDIPERAYESTVPAVSVDKQHARIGAALAALALDPHPTGPRQQVIQPILAFPARSGEFSP